MNTPRQRQQCKMSHTVTTEFSRLQSNLSTADIPKGLTFTQDLPGSFEPTGEWKVGFYSFSKPLWDVC